MLVVSRLQQTIKRELRSGKNSKKSLMKKVGNVLKTKDNFHTKPSAPLTSLRHEKTSSSLVDLGTLIRGPWTSYHTGLASMGQFQFTLVEDIVKTMRSPI